MRVKVVTSSVIPHVGGASTHIELLISQLQKAGIASHLIHYGDAPPKLLAKVVYSGFRLVSSDRARAYWLGRAVERMKGVVESGGEPSDDLVIHCHDPLATCAALRAYPKSTAVIQTVHGPWSKERLTGGGNEADAELRAIRRLEEEAFSSARALIAVDQGQAEILRSEFAVPSDRIRIISNAVDADQVQALARGSTRFQLPPSFFLVPRRLVPKNGVVTAIRALAQASAPASHVVIAGDGPLRPELEELARALGVHERVQFLGDVQRPEVLKLMNLAVAVIVPSVPANGVIEATSLAVLESMASGTPVIGSAIGGIAEIIESGRSGMLVPPGDENAMAAAMRSVEQASIEQRHAMIAAAKERIQSQYGADSWMEKIRSVYEEVIRQAAYGKRGSAQEA